MRTSSLQKNPVPSCRTLLVDAGSFPPLHLGAGRCSHISCTRAGCSALSVPRGVPAALLEQLGDLPFAQDTRRTEEILTGRIPCCRGLGCDPSIDTPRGVSIIVCLLD